MQDEIEQIVEAGEAAIAAAASTDALAQVETDLFGKRSALSGAHRSLGSLDPDARKEAGRRVARGPGRAGGSGGHPPESRWPSPSGSRSWPPTAWT